MQNRAITKQIGQHHFHFRVLFIMALYYDLSGDFFFSSRNSHIDRKASSWVRSRSRGCCTTLRHALRHVAPVAEIQGEMLSFVFPEVGHRCIFLRLICSSQLHTPRFLNDKRSEFLIYDYQKFLDVNRSE